jgi:sec-independent protein translocase protein TatA
MPSIGPLELAIVLVIALIVLGPKRLPEAGRGLGKGMREFRGALTSKIDGDDEADTDAPVKSTSAPRAVS